MTGDHDRDSWYDERDNRTMRYAGRRLDPARPIWLSLEADYASTYSGQVLLLVLSNLLGRMSPRITIQAPQVEIVEGLPSAGSSLVDTVLAMLHAADPHGHFNSVREAPFGAYSISLGTTKSPNVAFGVGWNAYFGSGTPTFDASPVRNPFGPALAAVLAAAHVFETQFQPARTAFTFNAFNWTEATSNVPFVPESSLGTVWLVGCGSVGTAIAYFLALAGISADWILVDGDQVKVHNLDRSPVFVANDLGQNKAEALNAYLTQAGQAVVSWHAAHLDETPLLRQRQNGTPDLIFAAANENDVRYLIESNLPPLQLYGTTGKNWQATLVRHIPGVDACSCCLFPPDDPVEPDTCATGDTPQRRSQDAVDAALPFLSFAAGLMAATEAYKLATASFRPSANNRVTFYTFRGDFRFTPSALSRRSGCVCLQRSHSSHRAMIAGTNFERVSI